MINLITPKDLDRSMRENLGYQPFFVAYRYAFVA